MVLTAQYETGTSVRQQLRVRNVRVASVHCSNSDDLRVTESEALLQQNIRHQSCKK